MKLLSIRLHPFGASMDRPFTLHAGLNVVEGPNEFGKSTLVHALWHALQTPTNLTPARLRDTMGRWYPRPAGDHARVTLRFEADGAVWTLEKTWGAGGASRLQADGAAAMADPATVQAKLHELLRLNTATWQQVLFTRQAQLAGTVEQLAKHGGTLDDVHALLQGAAAIPGDIPAERLRSTLEERIADHFSRWDVHTHGPEGGRGIANPWKNKLGPVVQAYYNKETLRAELDRVVAHEHALDTVNERIGRLKAEADKDAAFITEGRTLRDGLSQRTGLQERVARLTGTVQQLMTIVAAWPGAEQVIAAKNEEIKRLDGTLQQLETELTHARKQAQAQALRQGYQRLTEALSAWEEARKKLAALPAVDPRAVKELRQLEQEIAGLRIQIEAQKLVARLESSGARAVTLQRGTEAPEPLALTPDRPWEGTAAGRLTVEADGLRLSVQSGLEDVDALFGKLQAAEQRRSERLAALGQGSLAEAEAAAKAHAEQENEVRNKEGLHQAALQGRTAEEWEAEVKALTQLPATRDGAVLEQERTRLLTERAGVKSEADAKRREADQWTQAHESVEKLMEKVLEHKGALKAAEQELATLPALPQGFSTVDDYLRTLTAREQAQAGVKQQLEAAQQERARLEGATPARTAEELRAELDLKEREFQRRLAEGEALLRIQRRLEAVVAARGQDDPLQGLTDAVARHFQALTAGRYTGVALEGTAPVQVNGAVQLPTDMLSQGTLGSLALATRLALAELYLRDDAGFLLLDDPFTDMDPERRTAAATAIREFARQRQVVLLTCHPKHAGELR